MALKPRLEIRQSQSLTLTPQLMQSIKLLQLSHLELSSFVQEELLANPLLEREETSRDQLRDEAAREPLVEETAFTPDLVETGQTLSSAHEIASNMDADVSDIYPEQVAQDSVRASTGSVMDRTGGNISAGATGSLSGSAGTPGADLDQYVARITTLSDHLSEQICLIVEDPKCRLIARNLIDNLDDRGYLAADLSVIAAQLGAEIEQVEQVLEIVQGVDPVGVFARDLNECLALQLAEKNRLDPMMALFLKNLDLVAKHDFDTLIEITGATREDIAGMLEEIHKLDPRPGRAFDGAPLHAIVPDVFVREGPNAQWLIELNSDALPKVLVNRTYYASIIKNRLKVTEKQFLVDCLQTANWLTRSLDQRAQTILKVATEIVRMQDEFLLHGVTHLKPMTLKVVADAIQMHESTVSRVTSNKYIATPRGLFEMKYFFTTALSSSHGNADHSAESVRHLIKKMIDTEDVSAILSDDTIADRLQKTHAIEVARRTVAKYREGLNIPSSVVRRRQKKSELSVP
ncbi:MAG: RNA polymerase factor sigma-54 [Devosiaceae bacterium]|nr:RNA polymerase factor sigma-54 [Devosiaceae bacterium]